MSQMSAPSLNALRELAEIRDYVAETQNQLKAGKMPDMSSLEQRTADLCRIIREASSDVQQKCAPELKQLACDLDDCEKELHAFYETVIALSEKQK